MGCFEDTPTEHDEFLLELLNLEVYDIDEGGSPYSFVIQEEKSDIIKKEKERKFLGCMYYFLGELEDDLESHNKKKDILDNALYYLYKDKKPDIRTMSQMKTFEPYKVKELYKISVLVIDLAEKNNIPRIFIQERTRECEELTGKILNFEKQLYIMEQMANNQLTEYPINFTGDTSVNKKEESENEEKIIFEGAVNKEGLELLEEYLCVQNYSEKNSTVSDGNKKNSKEDLEILDIEEENSKKEEEIKVYENRNKKNASKLSIITPKKDEENSESSKLLLLKNGIDLCNNSIGSKVTSRTRIFSPQKIDKETLNTRTPGNNENIGEVDIEDYNPEDSQKEKIKETNKEDACDSNANNKDDSEGEEESVSGPQPLKLKLNNNNTSTRNNDLNFHKHVEASDDGSEENVVYLTVAFRKITFDDDEKNLELFFQCVDMLIVAANLKKIYFVNNELKSDNHFCWEKIVHLLDENYFIRYINLSNNGLNDTHFEELFKALEDKRPRALNIKNNNLSDTSIGLLKRFISYNKTLQKISFGTPKIAIKEENIMSLCDAFSEHPNLKTIDFSDLDLNNCGEYVKNLIENSINLNYINVKNCNLNSNDFELICFALKNSDISLQNINFSFNNKDGDKTLKVISDFIKCNKRFRTLNLERMDLNMANYNIIFDALESSDAFSEYHFSFNPLVNPNLFFDFFSRKENIEFVSYVPFSQDYNEKSQKIEFNKEHLLLIDKLKASKPDVRFVFE